MPSTAEVAYFLAESGVDFGHLTGNEGECQVAGVAPVVPNPPADEGAVRFSENGAGVVDGLLRRINVVIGVFAARVPLHGTPDSMCYRA